MKGYRVNEDLEEPKAVEWDGPNGVADSDGETVYENTHFESLDAAWEKQAEIASGWVWFVGRRVKEVKAALREQEAEAGRAAEYFAAVQRKRQKWLESKRTEEPRKTEMGTQLKCWKPA